MDFNTRDMYRKEIERLSLATGRDEIELAEIALELARSGLAHQSASLQEAAADASPMLRAPSRERIRHRASRLIPILASPGTHIGEVLLGKGRTALEHRIGYKPDLKTAVKRWVFRNASFFYLSMILLLSLIILVFIWLAAGLPALFPSISRSSGGTPWSIDANCRYYPAAMDYRYFAHFHDADPGADDCHQPDQLVDHPVDPAAHSAQAGLQRRDTRITSKPWWSSPVMIARRKDIDSLTHQLELHYLRNPEPGLSFALLTDFGDADSESLPEDESLVQYCCSGDRGR